jgi:hypothetical protein
MPDILHRISIDAPREAVHDLVATTDGIARWWTGRPLDGDSTVGSRFGIYFGDADTPAAVMEIRYARHYRRQIRSIQLARCARLTRCRQTSPLGSMTWPRRTRAIRARGRLGLAIFCGRSLIG